jgi:hypothetical protein
MGLPGLPVPVKAGFSVLLVHIHVYEVLIAVKGEVEVLTLSTPCIEKKACMARVVLQVPTRQFVAVASVVVIPIVKHAVFSRQRLPLL